MLTPSQTKLNPTKKEFIKLALVHNIEQWNKMTMAEKGDNDLMRPFCTTCMADGHVWVLDFCDSDECHEWHAEVMAIKDSIACVNQHKWCPEPWLSSHWDDWLPMVCAFSQKWGADRVPKDVKRSREEVEAGLQAAN